MVRPVVFTNTVTIGMQAELFPCLGWRLCLWIYRFCEL